MTQSPVKKRARPPLIKRQEAKLKVRFDYVGVSGGGRYSLALNRGIYREAKDEGWKESPAATTKYFSPVQTERGRDLEKG